MKFILEIESENEAVSFREDVENLIERVYQKFLMGMDEDSIIDFNGNRVGYFRYVPSRCAALDSRGSQCLKDADHDEDDPHFFPRTRIGKKKELEKKGRS